MRKQPMGDWLRNVLGNKPPCSKLRQHFVWPRGSAWREARATILQWGQTGLDLLYPPCCPHCEAPYPSAGLSLQICPDCRRQLATRNAGMCSYCGLPRPETGAADERCLYCRKRRFHFERVVALGIYAGPWRQAILRMKHAAERPLAAAVGHWMSQELCDRLQEPPIDVLVPTPKHWWRRLATGTNTAEILAQRMATQWGIASACLLRSQKNPRKQSLLSWTQRQSNMRHAFRLERGCDLSGVHVGLVDDIMTSGATAHEAAGVLRAAGASRVTAIVAARALHPDQGTQTIPSVPR